MKKTIYSGILFLVIILQGFVYSQSLLAQKKNTLKVELTFNGKVIDTNGKPIENVTVHANQGGTVVTTDKDGTFNVKVNPNSELLIETKGYETVTISALSKDQIITLKPNNDLLGGQSTIPVAFRIEKKKLLLDNVSNIDVPEILKNDNVSQVQNILDVYGSGIINGTNLLGIGNALVLVDGLARDPSELMPEEIESITLLKDVNAAVLYGSQAKNGVILIKTKRGVANIKNTRFSFESGINVPIQLPQYLDSKDYLTLYSEAQLNDNPNKLPDYSASDIAKYNGQNQYRYPDVNYYGSDYLKSMYNSSRFVGEFSGGNNVATYYTNIGWEHQDALYKSDTYNYGSDRLRVRANLDYNINDHISSHLDAAFVFDMANTPRTDFFTMASTYRPNDYSPLLPATMFDDPTIIDPLVKVNGNNILGGQGLTSLNTYGKNILGELNLAGNAESYQRTMQFNAGVAYDISQVTKGLKLSGDISFDTYASFSDQIQNTYAVYEPIWDDTTGKISGLNTINNDTHTGVQTLTSGSLLRSIMSKVALDYERTFENKHHFTSSLFGYYSMATVQNSLYSTKDAHIGIQAGYDYKGRYIADFSGAVINSDKLAPGHRVSFSPSVGLGWIVSGEDFWNKDGLISFFKLKASAGILQTDANFGYNLFREIYSGGNNFGTGDTGGYNWSSLSVTQIANSNLGMEKMMNFNLGFESALLDKTIFVEASFYKTRYADQIVQRLNYYPTLMSTFIPYENYNVTDYTGANASITYKKKIGEFSLSAGFSLLYAESKYVKVDEIHDNTYQYLVGTATDAFRGLKFTGFFATDAQAAAAHQQFGTIRRGDMSYADLDKNGYVNNNDMTVLGNYDPRFTGKLNFDFGYKGFSLFISAETQLGYDWVMSSTEAPNPYFWVDGNTKYSSIVLGRWTDQTASTATYPRLTAQTSTNNFIDSNFWIRNGNDISISRVQLNYTLPQKILKDCFIKGTSIYLRGDNLLLIAQDAALRQTSTSVLTRNFSLGLKMSF